jgi:hypothetical protein
VLARNGAGPNLCRENRGEAGLDFISAGKHGLNSRSPQNPQWALQYGNTRTPLALVVPDRRWPNMWRVHWPDGQISDLANLSRARDAALAICERGPLRRYEKLFRWRKLAWARETARSPLVRLTAERAPP